MRKKREASIGVRVNETKSENRPAKTMVRPNWRKYCPVMPCMKAIGMKTAASQSVMAMAAMPISVRPFSAASSGASPICRWRTMFSSTTIESSTRMPTQSVMPIRDIMLKVKPARYMTKNVEISDVGIAIMTAAVERQPRRNRKSTRPVVMRPSISVFIVLCSEART